MNLDIQTEIPYDIIVRKRRVYERTYTRFSTDNNHALVSLE